MKVAVVVLCALLSLGAAKTVPLPVLNVDTSNITVSGISAGAFFAVQMHVAFSSQVYGAGVVAGGPFYCAQGSEATAVTECMTLPEGIDLSTLYSAVNGFSSKGSIDNIKNLANGRAWLFSGTKDTVVNPGTMKKLLDFYKHYMDASSIVSNFTVEAEHGQPTLDYGNACPEFGSPFIQKCNFDGAGQIMNWLMGALKPATSVVADNLLTFDQSPFFGSSNPVMYDTGFVYVPTGCQSNSTRCRVHVAFHGCEQNPEFIGGTYALQAGYNTWAEANNIVILYPQAAKDELKNPNACFDWWGYTCEIGDKTCYVTQKAPQMQVVQNMLQHLGGGSSKPTWRVVQ